MSIRRRHAARSMQGHAHATRARCSEGERKASICRFTGSLPQCIGDIEHSELFSCEIELPEPAV